MKAERGSAPIWFLGLAVAVMMLGSISAELWRLIGERQELSSMADAAALAAAGAVAIDRYRASGEVVLEPDEAVQRALATLAAHSGADDLASPPSVEVAPDLLSVRVELARQVPLGLIRILALEDESFLVRASAVAYPTAP